MRGRTATIAVGVAILAVACTSFLGEEGTDPPATPPDAGDDAASAADGPGSTNTEAGGSTNCSKPAFDQSGCECENLGATQVCFQGTPGERSACTVPGALTCTANSDGSRTWSECVGGTEPQPVEACHDLIDNNCDGQTDENCACGATDDYCHELFSGALFPENEYSAFTRPKDKKINQPFDLYIVTKTLPLEDIGINRRRASGSDVCLGGGTRVQCAGSTICDGWKVAVFKGLSESTEGSIAYDFHPGTSPPCTQQKILTYASAITD